MTVRPFRPAAFAAMLALALVPCAPRVIHASEKAPAGPEAEQQLRLNKLFALKVALNRQEARERFEIAKARAYRKKHGKWPKGFKLEHETEGRADAERVPAALAQRAREAAETPVATSFPPNVRANDPSGDLFSDAGQSETSIAAAGGNVLLAWNDGNGFDVGTPPNWQLQGFGYSTNTGASWTDGGIIPPQTGSPNWVWASDPVVTVREGTGDFWYAGLISPDGLSGSHNGVGVVKGSFTGSTFTWGNPVIAVQGLNTQNGYDKEWLTVDPASGYLYLVYTDFVFTGSGSDQIEFVRSLDGGASWTPPTVLSSPTDNANFAVQGSRVAVGPSGEVYVVWQALGDSAADYFKLRKSTNNGTSWSSEVKAARYFSNFGTGAPGFNRGRGITYPAIAVDRTSGPYHGRVYLAWNEAVNWYPEVLNGITSGSVTEPEATSGSGVNDTPANAISFTIGNRVRGWVGSASDLDYFKFNAVQGKTYTFYCDTVGVSLDLDSRLYCSDQATRLALSTAPAAGYSTLITWTAPATGTYYLRSQAFQGVSGGTGYYSIASFVHNTPSGDDRARDDRDIFVGYSSDGLTWNAQPVRVNDDSPWLDDWLPEIAITGNSRLFCTWFDWRDANPSTCYGESNVYLFRSDDGSATWNDLGRVSDATSSWSATSSNIAPNQGDYVSIYANNTGVFPAWGDGRDGNPNVYTVGIPVITPTLAALASSRVESGQVEMVWYAADHAGTLATLERRSGVSDWIDIASRAVDASGQVSFVDDTVQPGVIYTYRLSFVGSTDYSSEAVINVPLGPALALRGSRPNPAERELVVAFSLPSSEPATLSLVDVSGRILRRREVGSLGAGPHELDLTEGGAIPSGVYLLELRQGAAVRTRRVTFVR